MGLIDFILNLAGLLLWVNWRTEPFNPQSHMSTRNLMGTLRRADAPRMRRWHYLAGLAALLFFRAVIYRQIGPAIHWTGTADLGAISISFRSDVFGRILLFSVISFGVALMVFYLCLIFLSLMRPSSGEIQPGARFTRQQLGFVESWPRGVRLVLPLIVAATLWWLASWVLTSWEIVPRPVSAAHRFEQSLLVGLGSYLAWKYLIIGALGLHMLNSYVYFGRHPFWNHVNEIARRLLAPLEVLPLRLGKV
ncbi:MAG: hypothetical protein EPO07_07980, partial [Verrucomicrobia bacterium]